MTIRLLLTKKDPRQTDFIITDDGHDGTANPSTPANSPVYSSHTTHYGYNRNGSRATTTITRSDHTGDRFQIGVIEWPARPRDSHQLVIGTRNVQMTRSGLYTSPERFKAADGYEYEWQIQDGSPQLVPLRVRNHAPVIATFHRSRSGLFRRKHTSSLLVSSEGSYILEDILVTFVYFECKWQDQENLRSHSGFYGSLL